MTKVLEIENLSVTYKGDNNSVVRAVNDISLSLEEGETLGLVGETGAGKTTTALSIMQLLPDRNGKITNGSIKFEGKDLTLASKADMQVLRGNAISMIFQDPMTSLNPVMSVGDQIEEVIATHHKEMKKEELSKKTDEILRMVGLPAERKEEYPHQFSGGMKQRIVIAIALACEPKLLLADEPTTALDVTIQAQILHLMKELKNHYKTSLLLITHDLGIVAQMCSKVAIMYAGEIIEYGPVEKIYESENHHPYTVGLFGSIPDMDRKEKRLTPIAGMMPDPANLPSGCSFCDRCPYAEKKCEAQKPALKEYDGHWIRCFRMEK